MFTINQVTEQIQKVEGFLVRIENHNGRKIRSDRGGLMPYGFRKATRNNITIRSWIKKRFKFIYRNPELVVVVMKPNGDQYGDLTRLKTVRNDWKEVG